MRAHMGGKWTIRCLWPSSKLSTHPSPLRTATSFSKNCSRRRRTGGEAMVRVLEVWVVDASVRKTVEGL